MERYVRENFGTPKRRRRFYLPRTLFDMKKTISVVVPAHNEERYISPCLAAIREAASQTDASVETVVVLNRCTDQTEHIAKSFGATCVEDQSRCLAAIRNKGIRHAAGDIIVTCDADSRMHKEMLGRVVEELSAGAVGGGVDVVHDRRSVGIVICEAFLRLSMRITGVSCGAFWTSRQAFDAVNGFNEALIMAEDFDFGRRLRDFGKKHGAPYRTLWDTRLLTSARKFDRYGDWAFFRMLFVDMHRIRRSLKGKDTEFVDEYFYDFNDQTIGRISCDTARK
jgi:glycosyltransferase involved in cell wall biosynthesis